MRMQSIYNRTLRAWFACSALSGLVGSDWLASTAGTVTASGECLSGYAAIQEVGGGLSTDGRQYQHLFASVRPQAGRRLHLEGDIWSGAWANHEWAAGWASLDSGILASVPNDYIMLHKPTGGSVINWRSRKAGGTEQVLELAITTPVTDTWYDWELTVKRDSATAGKGIIKWGWRTKGGVLVSQSPEIGSQFPDTVDMAPFFAWNAGTANTDEIARTYMAGWQE